MTDWDGPPAAVQKGAEALIAEFVPPVGTFGTRSYNGAAMSRGAEAVLRAVTRKVDCPECDGLGYHTSGLCPIKTRHRIPAECERTKTPCDLCRGSGTLYIVDAGGALT